MVFRRIIVKDWYNTMDAITFRRQNKIIVHEPVIFYYKYWRKYNGIYYSKEKQVEYLKKQYESSYELAFDMGREAKKYVNTYKLNLNTATVSYIRNWIANINYFIKN